MTVSRTDISEDQKFQYMMLSRWKMDIEYYFGYGRQNDKILFNNNFKDHIREMINLWKELPYKPEWLRATKLIEYKNRRINVLDRKIL